MSCVWRLSSASPYRSCWRHAGLVEWRWRCVGCPSKSITLNAFPKTLSPQFKVSWSSAAAPPSSHSLLRRPRSPASSRSARLSRSKVTAEVNLDPKTHLPDYAQPEYLNPSANPHKEPFTPLAQIIHSQIHMRGPLSLAEYMQLCLQHPQYGYYMTRGNVIGGKKDSSSEPDLSGDFITSPEISQVFGEAVGIWCVDVWMKLGQPQRWTLLEMGPGRGTLVDDLLNTIGSFPRMTQGLSLHLLETSPLMRKAQRDTLGVDQIHSTNSVDTGLTKHGVRVSWHHTLHTLPQFSSSASSPSSSSSYPNTMPSPFTASPLWSVEPATSGPLLVVAHEFFDSLPIHSFEYTSKGWCEHIIDYDTTSSSPFHLRFLLSNGMSPAIHAFQLEHRKASVGDRLEVCPAGLQVMDDLCRMLSKHAGAALIIDYGYDGVEVKGPSSTHSSTLQAVKDHTYCHPLHLPGETDLTSLVDFHALSLVATRYSLSQPHSQSVGPFVSGKGRLIGVRILPVLSQSSFLRNVNVAALLERLVNELDEDEMAVTREVEAATRLVEEGEGKMGSLFRVFSLVTDNVGVPVGWNEDFVKSLWEKHQPRSHSQH